MKVVGWGAILLIGLAAFLACSKPRQSAIQASGPSPDSHLQQIPSTDPEKYGHVRDMKTWRNPYMLVKADGFWLLDVSNNEEHPVRPDQVLPVLAALPASAWPYGRIVAVQEVSSGSSDAERIALRKNRAILAGTLESAKVLINWVPTA